MCSSISLGYKDPHFYPVFKQKDKFQLLTWILLSLGINVLRFSEFHIGINPRVIKIRKDLWDHWVQTINVTLLGPPRNHVPKNHIYMAFWTLPGTAIPPLPWWACSNACPAFLWKKFLLVSNLNLPRHTDWLAFNTSHLYEKKTCLYLDQMKRVASLYYSWYHT